jgi:hypothetical protein
LIYINAVMQHALERTEFIVAPATIQAIVYSMDLELVQAGTQLP